MAESSSRLRPDLDRLFNDMLDHAATVDEAIRAVEAVAVIRTATAGSDELRERIIPFGSVGTLCSHRIPGNDNTSLAPVFLHHWCFCFSSLGMLSVGHAGVPTSRRQHQRFMLLAQQRSGCQLLP